MFTGSIGRLEFGRALLQAWRRPWSGTVPGERLNGTAGDFCVSLD
jgi:hypothetical protein